jgi:TRAP transporter TAXI family solute receptor
MTISRRTVFMAGAGVLATGLIGAGGAMGWGGRAHPITIAGGPEGSVYLEFAKLLAAAINAAERHLTCTYEVIEGGVANVQRIGKGDAHLGVVKADGALAALKGKEPFESAVPLRAIGRIYQDYLQIVVRSDASLRAVADLNGRKVWAGTRESGTALFATRLIEVAGLNIDRQLQPLTEATTALENGEIDAMVWMGGVPTPALTELHRRVGITLLPAADVLPMLRSNYGPVYQQASIPPGSYATAGIVTVGVANLLVCADTLADDIAAAVTRVLIDQATQLVPSQELGTQFLDRRSLITTLDVPMHPGAASVYRHQHG